MSTHGRTTEATPLGPTAAGGSPIEVDEWIGPYHLEREVARGGTSVVYRASRDGLSVALKWSIRPLGVESGQLAVRFRREAAFLARFTHKSLVRVIDVGEHRQQPYLVMELVEGRPLSQVLRGGALPEHEVVGLARELASALAEVHRLGIVHRDVKPHNVVVTGPGRGKLIDFGLATGGVREEDEEEVVGTFLYSAPEQTGILKRAVDARSDLYALGALLFQCATGRPPFLAKTMPELLRQHAATPVPDPQSLNPEVRGALSAVITKLLAKDPDDRYSSAESLLADLNNLAVLEHQHATGLPLALDSHPAPLHREPPLVGRDVELAALRQHWRLTAAGAGGAVCLAGGPGLGKSRLARELGNEAAREGRVVFGRCESAHSVPLSVMRAVVDRLVDGWLELGPAEPERTTEVQAVVARNAALLVGVIPKLARFIPRTIESPPADPDHGEERFYAALAETVMALARARAPVLLIIEDAQWIDEGSAQVLERLARLAKGSRLMVLVTSRDDDRSKGLAAGLEEATQVHLATLDAAGTRELLCIQLGSDPGDDFVQWVGRVTYGNPFALIEIVRTLIDDGALRPSPAGWVVDQALLGALRLSDDVFELVLKRLDALNPAAKALLARAAAIGTRMPTSLAARVLGVSLVDATRLFEEAERANVVERRDVDGYEFVHERVREALLRKLTPAELADTHQAIVDAIQTTAKETGEAPNVFVLARHAALGHVQQNAELVANLNEHAGLLALQSHSHEEAYGLLSTARRLRGDSASLPLIEGLAAAAVRTGRLGEGFALLDVASRLAQDPVDFARIKAHVARALLSEGRSTEAWERVQEGLEALHSRIPRSPLRRFLGLIWHWLAVVVLGISRIGYGSAKGEARRRREIVAELADLGSWSAYFNRRVPIVIQLAILQMHNAHYLGVSPQSARGHAHYAGPLSALKLTRPALSHVRRGIEMAQGLGDRSLLVYCRVFQALVTEVLGETARSEQLYRDVQRDVGTWLGMGDFHRLLTDLAHNLFLRGRAQEVVDLLTAEVGQADRLGNPAYRVVLRMYCASQLALLGRFREASLLQEEARGIGGDNVFAETSRQFHALQILLDEGELGAPFDEQLQRFQALGVCDYHCAVVFILDLYRWVERWEVAAGADDRREIQQQIAAAIAQQNEHAGPDWATPPVYLCHRLVHQAALSRAGGKASTAYRLLERAERMARQADSSWGLFEVARERARWAKSQGDEEMAEQEAGTALEVAVQHGWRNRVRRIRIEFALFGEDKVPGTASVAGSATATAARLGSKGGSPNTVSKVSMTSGRHLESLLRVSLGAVSALDPSAQASAALDEVLLLLGAERALLFTADAEGTLKFACGRSSDKRDTPEVTGFSASVVNRTGLTREATVVTGLETLGDVAGASIATHGLRSIVAVPLVIGDRLTGVVYADSQLARGLFTADDVHILQALSNHIAIGLELSGAARREIERRLLEKDLTLAATAQSLFLPKSSTFTIGQLALAGSSKSASQTGGDFWWYDQLPDGGLRILLGDVTGHGAGPAIVTSATVGACEALRGLSVHLQAGEFLARIDEVLARRCAGAYLVAFTLCDLDAAGGVRLYGAGCPPVSVLRAGRSVQTVGLQGTLLGSGEEPSHPPKQCSLEPGDRLCILSDGVTELRTSDGKPMRLKNVLDSVGTAATALRAIEELNGYLEKKRGATPLEDDVTAIVVDRIGPPQAA